LYHPAFARAICPASFGAASSAFARAICPASFGAASSAFARPTRSTSFGAASRSVGIRGVRHAVPFRIAGELVLRQDAAEAQVGVRPRAQREPIDRGAADRDAMERGDLLARADPGLEQPDAGTRFSAPHF